MTRPGMRRSAVRTVVLVLISTAVGIGHARYRGLPLFPNLEKMHEDETQHETWAEETAIELQAFVRHYEVGGLVIDARPRDQFEEEHLDAPVIMNIPGDEAADGFHFERVIAYQGPPVVLYCASEACESAEILWLAMQSWGFSSEVRVYHPGWEGILENRLPAIDGPDAGYDLYGDESADDPNGWPAQDDTAADSDQSDGS